jgi:hypothetical protein
MVKKTVLHDNFEVNFTLQGFTSVLIGGYFFLLGYVYKYILESFLIDGHALAFLSPEIIEILFISLAITFVFLCSCALFFSGLRTARSFQQRFWNSKTINFFFKFIIIVVLVFVLLTGLTKYGFVDLLMPIFLIIYAIFLFFVREKERKNLIFLSILALLLGILCFIIPSYWNTTFTILAISHITYGVLVR